MKLTPKFGMYWLAALSLVVVATGCSTYNERNTVRPAWRQSNFAQAEAQARYWAAHEANTKDAVLWKLEEGAVLRVQSKLDDSNGSLAQAEDRINAYDEQAKVSLTKEGGAILSNQENLPYRGRAYDGIMMNTYKALNFLQLGQPDKARVELIRASQRQLDAVEEHKKEIEKTQEALGKSKDKDKVEKAQQDPKFQGAYDSNFAALDQLKPYGDYENPFTLFLDGLVFMANATTPDDLDHSRKDFERVSSFAEDNKFLKADLTAMEGAVQGRPIPPTTYVIFETGSAPFRDQFRIDIAVGMPGVPYVGAAFPILKFENDYAPSLNVSANGATETTALVASMDSVVGRDFKNELPAIITKTIASTITKAVAAWAIQQGAGQAGGDIGKLVAKAATTGYQVANNIADTRTWTTLPKEFQVCRIPTPQDRKLDLAAPNGQTASITVDDGTFNVVYVKCISAAGPLVINQFKLK